MPQKLILPDDKEFAFTIIDDTDHGTVENLKPIYDLLERYGLKTTKTAWVRYPVEDLYWHATSTLENPEYLRYILELKSKGFEIAWHGPAGESSRREQVIDGMERFEALVGTKVTLHVNHQRNRDNLYWGAAQLPAWRRRGILKVNEQTSEGHVEGSPYFWGDIARQRIKYVRGNSYFEINTLKCDPYMPYYNPSFPYANAWFSCANGGNFPEFVKLLSNQNLNRLQKERGVCIMYTHLGSRPRLEDPTRWLDANGEVKPQFEEILANLQRRNGWYVPVSTLLDHLGGGRVHRLTRLQALRLQLLKYKYRSL